jgi:methyl-accepting chemotaxis protein
MTLAASTPARQVRFSIFVRCALIVAVATALVAATVTVSSVVHTRQIAFDGLLTKAEAVTRSVAAPAGGAIRFGRLETLEADLDLLFSENGGQAAAAVVIDAEGRRLVESGARFPSHAPDLLDLAAQAIATGRGVTDRTTFLVAEPVGFGPDGAIVGAVAIAWSTEAAASVLARAQLTILALSATVLAAVLGGGLLYLRQTVARPLREIGRAMKQVVGGDYGITVPQTDRMDEIGLMARDIEYFRGMMSAASDTTKAAMFQSAAFQSSSAAMVLADRDFNITMTNTAFTTLWRDNDAEFRATFPGIDAMNLAGRNIDVFHGSPGRNRGMVLQPGALPMKTDVRIASKVMQLSIDGIADGDGANLGYVVEWSDVTEIRRDTAVLQGLEMRQVGMRFTTDWTFESGSGQFEAVAGAGAARFKGRKVQDLVKVEGMDVDTLRSRLARGETVNARFQLALGAEATRVLEGSLLPICDAKGHAFGFFLLGLDITEQNRALAAAEAASHDLQAAQKRVVDVLRTGLARLRDGDLTYTIAQPLGDEYETLRTDFNEACSGLQTTILGVGEMVETVQGDVREIAGASDNLSRRTEHQAATLEQTAAALAQITAAVNSAAEAARNALAVVTEARGNAESSGRVVEEAVAAMGEISQSSRQISRIVSVIDDIAFQTNLLALNAGVEAARAGDAGRGFAVVASEVRALAQRSSEAAREIGGLIAASGRHVEKGVDLVGEAGEALSRIAASVNGISDHVANIVHSAQEQSTSLNEVNGSMTQLDQVTQQNAAMFEETSAASQSLMSQAEALAAQMARFHVGDKTPRAQRPTQSAPPAAATPAPRVAAPRTAPASDGALALRASEPDWEDF